MLEDLKSSILSDFTLKISIALVILAIFLWVQERWNRHSVFKNVGIPHIKPHLIYGSLHLLRTPQKGQLEVMEEWIEEYGQVFGYYIGLRPHLMVTDLDMIRAILVRKSDNYINRPKLPIKANPVTETLVGLRDKRWKDVRHMLAPAFSMTKIKLMSEIVEEKLIVLFSILEKSCEEKVNLDILPLYQGFSLDVISRSAFDMDTNCMKLQNEDVFFAAVRQFLRDAINIAVIWAQYFPILAEILTVVNNCWTKSGKATQMIISHLKKAIYLRKNGVFKMDLLQLILNGSKEFKFLESQSKDSSFRDFSDKFESTDYSQKVTTENSTPLPNLKDSEKYDIDTQKLDNINLKHSSTQNKKNFVQTQGYEGSNKETPEPLTENEIIANAWVFLLGGYETTASALTFTTYLLAKHPVVQQKLFEEVIKCQKVDEIFSISDVYTLKYMDQVVNESLRLFPPVVTFLQREAKFQHELNGYIIPKDTTIVVPIWHIHHNSKYWPDPYEFRPSRFHDAKFTNNFEAVNLQENSYHSMSFLPFGAGPRGCIGMRFSQAVIKMVIANVLQKYRIETCENTPENISCSVPTVTLVPNEKMFVKFVNR